MQRRFAKRRGAACKDSSSGPGSWFELIAYHVRSDIGQGIGAQATFELAIAKSLGEIAKQAHEMADASNDCSLRIAGHPQFAVASIRRKISPGDRKGIPSLRNPASIVCR
jgi:hypothetical protein